jgi:hypothetical protein
MQMRYPQIIQQGVDQMGADEPGASGDERPGHGGEL